MNRVTHIVLQLTFLLGSCTSALYAQAPAVDSLLPDTTKGLILIPDTALFAEQFNKTNIGKLLQLEEMQPFAEELNSMIAEKMMEKDLKLELKWEDIKGIASGEVGVASIQPENDNTRHASAMLVDVSGNEMKAKELLKKVDTNLQKRGGTKATLSIHETEVTRFTFTSKVNPAIKRIVHTTIVAGMLIVVSDEDTAGIIIGKLLKKPVKARSLNLLPRYQEAWKRIPGENGLVKYYIDPFGYAHVIRAAAGGKKRRGEDLLKVLSNQGFSAVEAVAGQIEIPADNTYDFVYHTFIYAPGDPALTPRFIKAARILTFPNSGNILPESWVPSDITSHISVNWDLQTAFNSVGSLVNDIADEDVFDHVLDNLKNDPKGPKIDIRKDFIPRLDERVLLLTSQKLPVDEDSERLLMAIKLKDADAVKKIVDKVMAFQPDVEDTTYKDVVIWEKILQEDEEEFDLPEGGFGDFGFEEEEAVEEEESLLNAYALCVSHGYLLFGSHADFVKKIIDAEASLSDSADFKKMEQALNQLQPNKDVCARHFSRLDAALRGTYKLIRDNRMPESKSLLGQLLNKTLGPEEEGVLREQQIDGKTLPPFEKVEPYLDLSGSSIKSTKAGWLISGCIIKK